VLLLLSLSANAQLSKSSWPKYHGDSKNTGLALSSGADNVLKWSFSLGTKESPVIGLDGTLYVGSVDDHLYALNSANGALKWTFFPNDLRGRLRSCPAIGSDGTIFVSSGDGGGSSSANVMYALHANSGAVIWSFGLDSPVSFDPSSPAIGADGTVYFGCTNRPANWRGPPEARAITCYWLCGTEMTKLVVAV